jgi:hypothetical protein
LCKDGFSFAPLGIAKDHFNNIFTLVKVYNYL